MTDENLQKATEQLGIVKALRDKCEIVKGEPGSYSEIKYEHKERIKTLYINGEPKLQAVFCEIARKYYNLKLEIEEKKYKSM